MNKPAATHDPNDVPTIAGIPDAEAVHEPGVTWTARSPRLKSGRLRKAAPVRKPAK